MKTLRDTAAMSRMDRKALTWIMGGTILLFLLYWWDAGFESLAHGLGAFAFVAGIVAVRFLFENRPEKSELHMVQLTDAGITGWDNGGRMVKIRWTEMSMVLCHDTVIGREITINGGGKRLRIRDGFRRFAEIAALVRDTCAEKSIKLMG